MMKYLLIVFFVMQGLLNANSSYAEQKSKELGRGYAQNILFKIESFEQFESTKNCEKAIINDLSIEKDINEIDKKRKLFYSDFFQKNPFNEEFTVKVFKECVLSLDKIKTQKKIYLAKESI